MKKIIPLFVAVAVLLGYAAASMNSAQSDTRVEKLKGMMQGKLPGKLGEMQKDRAFNKASRKADRQGNRDSRQNGHSSGCGCQACCPNH